ncbi:arylsulfatase J-like [Mytilus trossulus]|uniref:arylsulfatase J-like n=1 Tax=Mytilus trossulus TaxID=6551 RepID=UPI0030078FF6
MFCVVLLLTVLQDVVLSKPNIIFILVDDYGFNDIGYHGSEIRTPNLDRLANEGVKLENYYVQPICTPTRSCLLSGRYQIRTGMQHGNIQPSIPTALPTDSLTIADKIQQAGYSTHCIGKWHLGFYKNEFLPTRRGFDTFYGFLVGSKSHYHHRRCDRGMCGDDFRENERQIRTNREYSTTLFSRRAVDIINSHQSSKPLFMYVPYQAPHSPLQAPKRYIHPYKNTIPDIHRRQYAGMVSALDEGVGNITRALKRKGLWENTIFIFSTDNGGQISRGGNNYPLRGNKGGNFEGGIRGVGFVCGGQVRNKGTVSRELMHVTDWFPTLVNQAQGNFEGVKPLDGFDVWNAISGREKSPREIILHGIDPLARRFGRPLFNSSFDTTKHAAIRYKDYKLLTGKPGYKHYNPNPRTGLARTTPKEPRKKNFWLFNIRDDPLETTDLSASRPQIVKEMLDLLAEYDKSSVPVRFPGSDPQANPELRGGFWGPWR